MRKDQPVIEEYFSKTHSVQAINIGLTCSEFWKSAPQLVSTTLRPNHNQLKDVQSILAVVGRTVLLGGRHTTAFSCMDDKFIKRTLIARCCFGIADSNRFYCAG